MTHKNELKELDCINLSESIWLNFLNKPYHGTGQKDKRKRTGRMGNFGVRLFT